MKKEVLIELPELIASYMVGLNVSSAQKEEIGRYAKFVEKEMACEEFANTYKTSTTDKDYEELEKYYGEFFKLEDDDSVSLVEGCLLEDLEQDILYYADSDFYCFTDDLTKEFLKNGKNAPEDEEEIEK